MTYPTLSQPMRMIQAVENVSVGSYDAQNSRSKSGDEPIAPALAHAEDLAHFLLVFATAQRCGLTIEGI